MMPKRFLPHKYTCFSVVILSTFPCNQGFQNLEYFYSPINSSSFSSLISSLSCDNGFSVSSKAFEDPRWEYSLFPFFAFGFFSSSGLGFSQDSISYHSMTAKIIPNSRLYSKCMSFHSYQIGIAGAGITGF